MSTFSAKARPYKLKPTDGDSITRDDVSTWSYTMLAAARQMKDWKQFLPNNSKDKWKAKYEDPTHGWEVTKVEGTATVIDDEATDKLKSDFQDFLTFVASHSPTNFMNRVMREATSYTWVIEQIHETYGLETKGEHFLSGNDMKFEFGSGFTYKQALMMMKDFYINALLPSGKIYKGKATVKDEELSPLAENFIIEKCLAKIHPGLPDHIKNSRGYLFTEERPTLSCNQNIIFDQIGNMLGELEGKESGSFSVGQVRNFRNSPRPSGFPFRGQQRFSRPPSFGGQSFRPRGFSRPPYPRPQFSGGRGSSSSGGGGGCIRCLEARRYDASKFHTLKDCTYPRQQPVQNTAGMKVLLVQDQTSQPQTPQQAEAMPQATNQPAFDPYSGNSYYDEGFYGNQSYDQSYAVADEGFGYLGHPDQDYHGQGYGGDL